MPNTSRQRTELWNAILMLRTLSEARRFFGDLLTEEEITDMAKRWQVARMLYAGETYMTIQYETALSTRTIARIASWLQGGMGGYRLMLARLNTHRNIIHPPHRPRMTV